MTTLRSCKRCVSIAADRRIAGCGCGMVAAPGTLPAANVCRALTWDITLAHGAPPVARQHVIAARDKHPLKNFMLEWWNQSYLAGRCVASGAARERQRDCVCAHLMLTVGWIGYPLIPLAVQVRQPHQREPILGLRASRVSAQPSHDGRRNGPPHGQIHPRACSPACGCAVSGRDCTHRVSVFRLCKQRRAHRTWTSLVECRFVTRNTSTCSAP